MDIISIKIQIAERVYPIKINKSEEAFVRSAAKSINKHIQDLQQDYKVRDTQDLLSMSLIHYANLALKLEQQLKNTSKETNILLDELNSIMSVQNYKD